MHQDDHLVYRFYLSRPHHYSKSPRNTQEIVQKQQQPYIESGELINRGSQMVHRDKKSQNKSNSQCKRILKMITNKMSPSTAVNTPIIINKTPSTKAVSSDKFIVQFEQFFRGFLKKECSSEKKEQDLKDNKSNQERRKVKKAEKRIKSMETNRIQTFEDEESFADKLREKNKKVTYHQRIKQQIDHRMDSILTRNKPKKHEIKLGHTHTISNVEKGLWLKAIGMQSDPKLRITKTGLPYHFSENDRKYTQQNSKILEREKAKKDRLFQKSLSKNNVITLNSIQNYQNKPKTKKQQKVVVPPKKMAQSRCLKDTQCTKNRKKMLIQNMRRSSDDLDHLKLRQKCLEIEWECEQSSSIYKQLSKGLKIFEGFNNAVVSNLNLKANTITKIMADGASSSKRNSIKYSEHQPEK